MEFGERLKFLRLRASLTQKQLGEVVGVSITTIRNWESGVKQPSMQAIIDLSNALNTSADTLLGIKSELQIDLPAISSAEISLLTDYRSLDDHGKEIVDAVCRIEKSRVTKSSENKNVIDFKKRERSARYIPIYTTPSAAGYSTPIDGDEFEMILVDESVPRDADFAVRIQGDSMSPYIDDGDTVYVKKTCELYVGDVGIFSVDGAMYCKIYYIDKSGNVTLVSANPAIKQSNVIISADSGATVVCCGKVILDEPVPFPEYFYEE